MKGFREAALGRICVYRENKRKEVFFKIALKRWSHMTVRQRWMHARVLYKLSKKTAALIIQCILTWSITTRIHLRGRARNLRSQRLLLLTLMHVWGDLSHDRRAVRKTRAAKQARCMRRMCSRLKTAHFRAWSVRSCLCLLAVRFLLRKQRIARQVSVDTWGLWTAQCKHFRLSTTYHQRRLQHLHVRRICKIATNTLLMWVIFQEERRAERKRLATMDLRVARLRLKRLVLCLAVWGLKQRISRRLLSTLRRASLAVLVSTFSSWLAVLHEQRRERNILKSSCASQERIEQRLLKGIFPQLALSCSGRALQGWSWWVHVQKTCRKAHFSRLKGSVAQVLLAWRIWCDKIVSKLWKKGWQVSESQVCIATSLGHTSSIHAADCAQELEG